MPKIPILVRLTGRCADGAERDGGRLIHVVAVGVLDALTTPAFDTALCGAKPGRRLSNGWVEVDGAEQPTCKRCAARAARLEADDDEATRRIAERIAEGAVALPAHAQAMARDAVAELAADISQCGRCGALGVTTTACKCAVRAHVRVGVVKAGRRINDRRGDPGTTICGAELTAYDLTVAEARRLRADTVAGVCQVCLAKLPTEGDEVQS